MAGVDLSKLPSPDAIETISYDDIKAQIIAALGPDYQNMVESDPGMKVAGIAAYRETLVRKRANDAVRACMLAFAREADLDQLGANNDVPRLVVTPGDPNASPPIPDVMEEDEPYRARIQLSFEGYTTAGSDGSYRFHALSATGKVIDVKPLSPSPGVVDVYVLSNEGNGTPSQATLDAVTAALSAELVRPMTDNVNVKPADIVEYEIVAELTLYPGPDSSVVLGASEEKAQAYADSIQRLGYDVSLSGIDGALHQPGVQNVVRTSPASFIEIADNQASYCTKITVTVASQTDD
jgi:phage-related baseplate assembly protein